MYNLSVLDIHIMNGSTVAHLNITFPKELIFRLKRVNKPRGISRFLAEATREKLDREEAKKALGQLLGAPKTFSKIEDSVRYIRKTRLLDDKRLRHLSS